MAWLKRLRGLIGLTVVGAVCWVPLGLASFAVMSWIGGRRIPWQLFPAAAMRFAVFGAVSGFFFGILLLALERRQTFGALTFKRTALWGALGGVALCSVISLTGPFVLPLFNFVIFGAIGACTSGGVLLVARRAPPLAPGAAPREIGSVSP